MKKKDGKNKKNKKKNKNRKNKPAVQVAPKIKRHWDPEKAIRDCISGMTEPLTARELLDEIAKRVKNAREQLDDNLLYSVLADGELFCEEKPDLLDSVFTPRRLFFRDFPFRVRPSEYEIANNILFPMDTVCPYLYPGFLIMPVLIKLKDPGDERIPVISHTASKEVVLSHLTLSMKDLASFLAAFQEGVPQAEEESPEDDADAPNSCAYGVFDMKDVYGQAGISFGDTLRFTILDWYKGEVKLEAVERPGSVPAAVEDRWMMEMDKRMVRIVNQYKFSYVAKALFPIALFRGGEFFRENPALDLRDYAARSSKIKLVSIEGQGVLWHADRDAEQDYLDWDAVFGSGDGEDDYREDDDHGDYEDALDIADMNLENLWETRQIYHKEEEILGILLDEYRKGATDIENAFRRIVKNPKYASGLDDVRERLRELAQEEWDYLVKHNRREWSGGDKPVFTLALESMERMADWVTARQDESGEDFLYDQLNYPDHLVEELLDIRVEMEKELRRAGREERYGLTDAAEALRRVKELGMQMDRVMEKLAVHDLPPGQGA
jgi:hypothetical protein